MATNPKGDPFLFNKTLEERFIKEGQFLNMESTSDPKVNLKELIAKIDERKESIHVPDIAL